MDPHPIYSPRNMIRKHSMLSWWMKCGCGFFEDALGHEEKITLKHHLGPHPLTCPWTPTKVCTIIQRAYKLWLTPTVIDWGHLQVME